MPETVIWEIPNRIREIYNSDTDKHVIQVYTASGWVDVFVPEDHHTRHEKGGDDEIDLTGLAVTKVRAGTHAERPATCEVGDMYFETDTCFLCICSEPNVWKEVELS